MAWELRARYNVNKPSIAGEEQRQGRGKEGEKDWVERRRKLSKGPGGDKRIMHRQQGVQGVEFESQSESNTKGEKGVGSPESAGWVGEKETASHTEKLKKKCRKTAAARGKGGPAAGKRMHGMSRSGKRKK